MIIFSFKMVSFIMKLIWLYYSTNFVYFLINILRFLSKIFKKNWLKFVCNQKNIMKYPNFPLWIVKVNKIDLLYQTNTKFHSQAICAINFGPRLKLYMADSSCVLYQKDRTRECICFWFHAGPRKYSYFSKNKLVSGQHFCSGTFQRKLNSMPNLSDK